MKIVDLSQEIFKGQPVYPGHQPTVVFPMVEQKDLGGGKRSFAVNTILLSEHAGTHTDSFIHNDPDPEARSIEELELERFLGPGICLDVTHVEDSDFITKEDVVAACEKAELKVPNNGVVLLYTGTYQRHFPKPVYNQKNPGLSREAAQWLVDQGAKNIGIDAVSIDVSPHKGEEWKAAHTVCVENQILNTENLGNLEDVAGKKFFYIGLPLKIRNGTAGLTRAVALLNDDKDEDTFHLTENTF
ncbi:cyclase family protein [Alteribacillus sp. YIM 98480]|uniref:cyclase family protein n=1 Tax=Alteribacillus sp. YIM 98480 TaxID=2606599 RepID=UPI00131AD50A|nr:cyclase family protein [Alteribacillus sp. YIM 98480]